jgi:N-methylhydantoinase A/oxoprolinase/acetone carboxylase beta subunit
MWDAEIAEYVLEIVMDRFNMRADEFINEIRRIMNEKLDSSAIEAALYFDHQEIDMTADSTYDYFLNQLFFQNNSSVLRVKYELPKKIVGIGAPAAAWLAGMDKHMQTAVIIPKHYEVANAVGAAVGRAVESMEILIRLDTLTNQYVVFSPVDRVCMSTLDEAAAYARDIATKYMHGLSKDRIYQLEESQQDFTFDDEANGIVIFMERIVKLTAHFES